MGANAQTSVPAFTSGQVLTAAQVTQINTGIPVFASSTERDAAFGGTGEKTLAEGQMAYLEDTNEVQYYDGSAWTAVAGQTGIALFNETQSSGTNGGTSTNTFTKRTLNTTVVNTISGCSISASVITLPAGTYEFHASAPAWKNNQRQTRLANTSDTTYSYGTSEYSLDTNSVITRSFVSTVLTIAGSKNFELQDNCGSTFAGTGLGVAASKGTEEVYSQITIRKIA